MWPPHPGLKTEARGPSEMLVTNCKTIQHNIPDHNLITYHHENLKSYVHYNNFDHPTGNEF